MKFVSFCIFVTFIVAACVPNEIQKKRTVFNQTIQVKPAIPYSVITGNSEVERLTGTYSVENNASDFEVVVYNRNQEELYRSGRREQGKFVLDSPSGGLSIYFINNSKNSVVTVTAEIESEKIR